METSSAWTHETSCGHYYHLFIYLLRARSNRDFLCKCLNILGAGIACWLQRRTRGWQVASSNPGRSGGRIFFSRVNCVCWLLFSVRSTPVLPQWHVKDPGHSAKKCKWQVTPTHAYTRDPSKSEWADYTAVQAECGSLSGNELTRNSSGSTRSQSSQLAEPL